MALAGEDASPPPVDPGLREGPRFVSLLRTALGIGWIGFQIYILLHPQPPLVERPVHLAFAIVLLILWMPLRTGNRRLVRLLSDATLFLSAAGTGAYYLLNADRITNRMDGVDPVLAVDMVFGILAVTLLLEGVRRAVGWPLLGVLLASLASVWNRRSRS